MLAKEDKKMKHLKFGHYDIEVKSNDEVLEILKGQDFGLPESKLEMKMNYRRRIKNCIGEKLSLKVFWDDQFFIDELCRLNIIQMY